MHETMLMHLNKKEVSRLYVTRHSLGYTTGMDNTVFNSVKLKSIDLVDSSIDSLRFSTICTFWHYQIGIYIATKMHIKKIISIVSISSKILSETILNLH